VGYRDQHFEFPGTPPLGPRLLRTALVEAAWIMQRYNPWAKAVYQRICANQKNRKKKAIFAVARKLLVRCWAMLLHETPWSGATTTTLSEAYFESTLVWTLPPNPPPPYPWAESF